MNPETPQHITKGPRRTNGSSDGRVSVIIPAYRAAGTIVRAVESVLNQSEPAFEILVIDDGSPEDLSSVLKPYDGHIRLIRQPNGGAARARNTGIDAANGNLLAFLDADDFWEPDKLKHHVELYRKHSALGLTCSRYFEQEPRQERKIAREKTSLRCDEVLHLRGQQAFEFGCKVWTGTVVVPRRLLQEARFVSGLEPAEDRHFWIALVQAAPVFYLSEPLATAVLEPNSLSRSNIETDCAQMLRVVDAYRNLLGEQGVKQWEAHVFRRLAGVHLAARRPRQALHPAVAYLKRQPINLRGWWVLFKSGLLSVTTRPQGHSKIFPPSRAEAG